MFDRLKAVTKNIGKNLGKTLVIAGATAIVSGAVAGNSAIAKVNTDTSKAIILSLGDVPTANKLLEQQKGYTLSSEIASLYSSALTFSNITPEKVTNELLQKASDDYFDKAKGSYSSFNEYYGEKVPVDIIGEHLFDNRLSLMNGDYFDLNMVGEAKKISSDELIDKFSDNYGNYIKKSDPDFYANSFKKNSLSFDSISVPNLADLNMTEITKDANEFLGSLSFEKDPNLEKMIASYEASTGEKMEKSIDVEKLLSENNSAESKKVRRDR